MMDDRDLEQMMDELCDTENISDTIELIYEIVSSPKVINDIKSQYDIIIEMSWYYPSSSNYEAWDDIFKYTDLWYDAWLQCFSDYNGIEVYAGKNETLRATSKFFL